jgi:hypothetical protein
MGKAGTGPQHSARIGPRRHRRSCIVTLLDPLWVQNGLSLSRSFLSRLYPSSDGFGSLLGPAGPPARSWCGGLSCLFPCPSLSTGSGGARKVVVEGPGESSPSCSSWCLSGSVGGMGHWEKSGMGAEPRPRVQDAACPSHGLFFGSSELA